MKKILIVEDEKSLSGALKSKLEKENFNVEVASNGMEGLQKAKEISPDLIIMDVIMPVMGGLEALEKIKADSSIGDIPILVLTNLSDGQTVARAIAGGSFDFLVKSDWSLESIIEKIKEKIN